MRKRSLKFFILHTVSRQLYSWAEYFSRQIDDEQAVQRTPANDMNPKTENAGEDSSESSVLEPAIQEPTQKDLGSVEIDTPPAHWLARVQKDAPEFLKQLQYSRPHVVRPPSTLPAELPPADRQTEVSKQRISRVETGQFEQAEHPAQLNETKSTLVEREATPGPTSGTMARVPVIPKTEPEKTVGVDVKQPLTFRQERVDTPQLPASQSETVQKAAPESFKQTEGTLQDTGGHFRALSPAQEASNAEREGAGQRPAITRIIQIAKVSSTPPRLSNQRKSEGSEHQSQAVAPVTPHPLEKEQRETRIQEQAEPAQIGEANTHSGLPFNANSDPWLQTDSSAWEVKRGTRANLQTRDDFWLPGSHAAQAGVYFLPDKASEQIQEMPWPTLPAEVATENRDWEMARRLWERQQRLDEEQRGSIWNG